MNLLLETMMKPFPKLNRMPHSFEDFEAMADRHRITVRIGNYNPEIFGYFCIRKTGTRTERFIVINANIDKPSQTFTGLHELAHYFLHVPATSNQWFYCRRSAEGIQSKQDHEADIFALLAMIPLWLLTEIDTQGSFELTPSLAALCERRRKLYRDWGI